MTAVLSYDDDEASSSRLLLRENFKEQRLHRVKVYLLSDVWIDKGTGYCFGELTDDDVPFLVVRNELNDEDQLLKAKIEGSVQFQRQQDTLIVWTDLDGKSIALSFQEKEGCSSLCDFIIQVHTANVAPYISLVSVLSNDAEGDITELIVGPIDLPPTEPTANDLTHIMTCFNSHTNSGYYWRSIVRFLKDNDYIVKLIQLFDECESQKQIKNLHLLCLIIKSLFAHEEEFMINSIQEDNLMIGLAGILEYDPDFPKYKASHRKLLEDESNFKELLPVKDKELADLIKKTFKLQFLKDVVLVRLLEDPTYNSLSGDVSRNQEKVIEFLESGDFIDELFKIYQKTPDSAEDLNVLLAHKREGIKVLHQFVLTAKNSASKLKTKFFKSLIKKGLLKCIEFVLVDDDIETRVLALELIVAIIGHDMLLMNISTGAATDEEKTDVRKRSNGKGITEDDIFNGDEYEKDDEDTSMLDSSKQVTLSSDMTLLMILTRFLLESDGFGIRIQAYEALKALLDPVSNVNAPRFLSEEARAERLNTSAYFAAFYEQVAPILFAPLIELQDVADHAPYSRERDNLFLCLCELVNFCTADRGASRSFFMENNILRGISFLIKPCHMSQLRLAGIRSLKALVLLNDDYYTRSIISGDLFKEVFALLDSLNGIPELAYSTVLDLLEIVLVGIEKGDNRKNFKLLANYIVTNYRPSLESIEDVNSGRDLIKCIETESTTTNGADDEFDRDDYSNEDILTEPLQEEDSVLVNELLGDKFKENKSLVLNTPEKRLRNEDENEDPDSDMMQQKKKNTLKERFANAGKKIVSKFGTSK